MTSEGNPQLQLRLEPLLRSGLQAIALTRNVTLNELAKAVLREYVKQAAEEAEGVPAILRHLDVLIGTLRLQTNQVALQQVVTERSAVVKDPMKAEKDTQADRRGLQDTVDAILKTVIKLCESEKAAANAKARMQALRLANTTIRTDLAILQGFDRRDVEVLMDEVRETNESLKAQLAASAKGTKRT